MTTTKRQSLKIKPCPLCGRQSHATSPVNGVWNIGCGPPDDDYGFDTCGLVLFGGNKDTRGDMIRKWNTRQKADP